MRAEADFGPASRDRLLHRLDRGATPWRIAAAVLAVHAVWILGYFAAGHEIRDFIKIGPSFVTRSHASSVIRYDPHYAYPQNHDLTALGQGYDGQFSYYIALDPSKARYYIDEPSYRYQRILYPLVVRFTALARPSVVPWTMLIINWLAVAGGVLALGAWLRRKGVSAWFAVIYGIYPGMLVALQRDLTEPLAYGLVASAIYLFDFGGSRGLVWSGVVFGLAALARETTLIFALLFGFSLLAGRPNATAEVADRPARLRHAATFGLLTLVPFTAWTVALWSWLGVPHGGTSDLTAPLIGAFQTAITPTRQPVNLLFVVIPSLLATGVATSSLRRLGGRTERLCLIVNVAFIIILASGKVWATYTSMGRVSVAIVLAALICLPHLAPLRPLAARSLRDVFKPESLAGLAPIASATLWLAMIPAVMYYGFSSVKV